MNTEEKAQELYPNNKTFCGGVAQIARDAFAKGARMQKEVDDKELSEKVSAAYQLGLSDREKQMMAGVVEGVVCYGSKGAYIETDFLGEYDTDVYGNPGDKVRIIIVKEEKDGTGRA